MRLLLKVTEFSDLNSFTMEFFVAQKNVLDMKPKQITIDLNADLGEYQSKNQYFIECQILSHISSCNIACGGHAGDEESMQKMILACKQKGVTVGAHPSYPDREGFGRRKITRNIQFVMKDGAIYYPDILLKSAEGMIGPSGADDHESWELRIEPLRSAK